MAAAIRNADDIHQPRTKLICLENTHNVCGGMILPEGYVQKVRAGTHSRINETVVGARARRSARHKSAFGRVAFVECVCSVGCANDGTVPSCAFSESMRE